MRFHVRGVDSPKSQIAQSRALVQWLAEAQRETNSYAMLMQEFQEQQIVPYHEVSASWLTSLGLNPTVEALAVQGVVLVLAIATFVVLQLRAKRAPEPGHSTA